MPVLLVGALIGFSASSFFEGLGKGSNPDGDGLTMSDFALLGLAGFGAFHAIKRFG